MDMQKFWDNFYRNNRCPYETPDSVMIEMVSGLKPGLAADLGAGEGNNSLWLARQGWRVTAVDFAPSAINRIIMAAYQNHLEIDTRIADITSYHLPRKQDLILLGYIHLEPADRKNVLVRASKSLRPGGMLLYLGITNVQEAQGETGDCRIFPGPDEIAADMQGLVIERAGENRRIVHYGEGETEMTGVTVAARKSL